MKTSVPIPGATYFRKQVLQTLQLLILTVIFELTVGEGKTYRSFVCRV